MKAKTTNTANGEVTNPSICFVNDFFLKDNGAVTTGPMVQVYLIGKELAKRGWQVSHVVSTKNRYKVGSVENHDGMRVHYLRHGKYGELPNASIIFRKLEKIEADVYYQRGRSPLTGIVAYYTRSRGKKFIWSSAGEGGVARNKYTREQLKKKRGLRKVLLYPYFWIQDRTYEYGVEKADLVFAQTEYQLKQLEREFGRKGEVFRSGHPIPATAIESKPDPPLILWIGAIKEAKQPDLFLRLAEQLAGENAKFVMIGSLLDQRYRPRLSHLANSQNNFSYQGQIPFEEMNQWFAGAGLVVNTTKKDYEGLPNTFIQAWLSGTPVVSLYSDPDEIIKSHGMGYQTGEFDDMVQKVRNLIHDKQLRMNMGRTARDYAVNRFGIEALVDRFVDIVTDNSSFQRSKGQFAHGVIENT